MASIKIATLIIRTIAKPISASLKEQARQHPKFRELCVGLAQRMHRTEIRMRYHLLGQERKAVRPLNEKTAVDNGANAIAEGFLFSVAASLIIAESWRSSRKESKRREGVADSIEDLATGMQELRKSVEDLTTRLNEERERSEQMAEVLNTVIQVALNNSLNEFMDTPLRVPAAKPEAPRSLPPPPPSEEDSP
ncbi:OPA3-domain-containing protein [Auricularia subglabra TFB-10046 SS5]|nr:OPA3-domain-containing protein [Auricularia subglabra TFB-10046 SS5]